MRACAWLGASRCTRAPSSSTLWFFSHPAAVRLQKQPHAAAPRRSVAESHPRGGRGRPHDAGRRNKTAAATDRKKARPLRRAHLSSTWTDDGWNGRNVRLGRNGGGGEGDGGLGVGMGPALSSPVLVRLVPIPKQIARDRPAAAGRARRRCMHGSSYVATAAWRAYAIFMALPGAAMPSARATPPPHSPPP